MLAQLWTVAWSISSSPRSLGEASRGAEAALRVECVPLQGSHDPCAPGDAGALLAGSGRNRGASCRSMRAASALALTAVKRRGRPGVEDAESAVAAAEKLVHLGRWLVQRGLPKSDPSFAQLVRSIKADSYLNDTATMTVVLRQMGRNGLWEDALSLIDLYSEMAVPDLEPEVFQAAMRSFEAARQWQSGLWLLDRMLRKGVSPTAATFRQAISVCEQDGHWQWSLSLLREMQGRGFHLDAQTYRSVLQACQKSGANSVTDALMEELAWYNNEQRALTNRYSEEEFKRTTRRKRNFFDKKVPSSAERYMSEGPNRWDLYTELARTDLGARRLLDVVSELRFRDWIQSMKELTIVVQALGRHGCWKASLSLVSDRLKATRARADSRLFTGLMSTLEKGRQWQFTLACLDEMPLYLVVPDIFHFNIAINACAKAGQWEQALAAFAMIAREGSTQDIVSYNALIGAMKGPQAGVALELMKQMKETSVEQDMYSYNTLLSTWESSGHWRQALSLIEEVRDRGLAPDLVTYSSTMRVCAAAAQWRRALHLFSELQTEGIIPGVSAYNAAASALIAGRKFRPAAKLLLESQTRGIDPNADTFRLLLAVSNSLGRWEGAIQILLQLRQLPALLTTADYKVVVEVCEQKSQWNAVVRLLEDMKTRSVDPDRDLYLMGLRACARGASSGIPVVAPARRRDPKSVQPLGCVSDGTAGGKEKPKFR